jgi:hypothetical protein
MDEYRDFSARNPNGLRLVAEPCGGDKRLALSSDAGDFGKWLQQKDPSTNIETQKHEVLIDRHSVDIWLGLLYIGGNIALTVFLNLVSSYLYDKTRGALRGDRSQVHLTVVYTDFKDGTCKKLTFEGDVDALKKLIEE